MNPYYQDYSEYMGRIFPGVKVQKLSVNAGFSCPNRDGTIGTGGCIYCNNTSFTPGYCREETDVAGQIEQGKRFFARKYPEMKYLAYFQSYTNTHGRSPDRLKSLYESALEADDVVGLIVGTRPDTLDADVVEVLGSLSAGVPVFVEIGAESSHDATLRKVNRGHDWQQVCEATERCVSAGLHVGLHLICGLPGEDEEDVIATVDRAVSLPVESLKFHQLQIIEDTPLCRMWKEGSIKVDLFTPERYLKLCERIVRRVPRRIAIERFLASAPPHMVAAPCWGLKNYQFTQRLLASLKAHGRPHRQE